MLDDAALVIQALGYRGHAPDILVDGVMVRPSDSQQRLGHTEDGAALIGGHTYPSLSVLRIEPTPWNCGTTRYTEAACTSSLPYVSELV